MYKLNVSLVIKKGLFKQMSPETSLPQFPMNSINEQQHSQALDPIMLICGKVRKTDEEDLRARVGVEV